MRGKAYNLIPILLLLPAACTSVAKIPKTQSVEISDVIFNVRCELHNAAVDNRQRHDWLSYWDVGVVVTLEVLQISAAAADATISVPLTNGSLSFKVAAGSEESATRSAKFDFSERLDQTDGSTCEKGSRTDNNTKLLTGSTGIGGWMTALTKSVDETDIKLAGTSYSLDFTIKPNGEVNPTFSALPLGLPDTISGGFKLSGSEKKTHSVALTFAKRPDPNAPPPAVRISGPVRITGTVKSGEGQTIIAPLWNGEEQGEKGERGVAPRPRPQESKRLRRKKEPGVSEDSQRNLDRRRQLDQLDDIRRELRR